MDDSEKDQAEGRTTEREGRGPASSQLPLAEVAPWEDRHMDASEEEKDMHMLALKG